MSNIPDSGVPYWCFGCEEKFSQTEFDQRHWHADGEWHEDCCPLCNPGEKEVTA